MVKDQYMSHDTTANVHESVPIVVLPKQIAAVQPAFSPYLKF